MKSQRIDGSQKISFKSAIAIRRCGDNNLSNAVIAGIERKMFKKGVMTVNLEDSGTVLLVDGKEKEILKPFVNENLNAMRKLCKTDFWGEAIKAIRKQLKQSNITEKMAGLKELRGIKKAGLKGLDVDTPEISYTDRNGNFEDWPKRTQLQQVVVKTYNELLESANGSVSRATDALNEKAQEIINKPTTLRYTS